MNRLLEMDRPFIERFKVWRLAKIREKKFSRGGRGLALDVAILHRAFGIAVECEMMQRNPVRLEGRPGDSPEHGAQPFTGDQLKKLRDAAKGDLLAYLLLRRTGLRGSDAVRLTWDEIDWEGGEINRLTEAQKARWGDSVATVEKHYAPFVKELQDRARRIMESGEGLEKTHCTNFAQSERQNRRIQ